MEIIPRRKSEIISLADQYKGQIENEKGEKLKIKECKNFDKVCEIMLKFLKCDARIKTVALAQGGGIL